MQTEGRRIVRFLSVGLLNTLVTLSIIVGSKWLLEWTDLWANAVGYVVGLCIGYTLNRAWTFQTSDQYIWERATRYLVTFFVSYMANLLVLAIGLNVLEINSYLSQVLTMPIYSAVFYMLCRTWVFRKPVGTPNSGQVALATALVIGILCIPITQTVVPPLADYPNHLARTYVAHHIEHDTVLQNFYVFEWRLITNILWDAIMAILVPLCGDLYLAGRLVLVLYMALLITGAMVLHRVWSGRWSYFPLLVSVFAYNGTFLGGFVVFGIGTGLALWATAGWHLLLQRAPWVRLIYGSVVSIALYLTHMFAFGTFGLLAGAGAIRGVWNRVRQREESAPSTDRDVWIHLAVTLLIALPVLALHLSNPAPSGDEDGLLKWSHFSDLYWLIYTPYIPAIGASIVISIGTIYLAARERTKLQPDAAIAMLALMCFWLVCPRHIYDTFFVNVRFLVLFVVLLPIAWIPREPNTGLQSKLWWSGITLLLISTTVHTLHWRNYNEVIDEMYEVIELLPDGVQLEHVSNTPRPSYITFDDEPTLSPIRSSLIPTTHIAALATIEKRAFIPTHFTHPPKHLLGVTESYRHLSRAQGVPRYYSTITEHEGNSRSLFTDAKLEAYDFILLSPAPYMTAENEEYHRSDRIYTGRWLWLLKRPSS